VDNSNSLPAILIVDDEEDILFTLSMSFPASDYQVETCRSGLEALEALNKRSFQLMILDLNMAPMTGLQVLTSLRQTNHETVVLILTAFSTLDSAIEAIRLGAFDYLIKPVEIEILRGRVMEGLKQFQRNHLITQQQAGDHNKAYETLSAGNLILNITSHSAVFNGQPLSLTTTEFNLLSCLVKASPNPIQPVDLVKSALGYSCSPLEAADIIKFHIH
jgi:two-component system, OmpR family, response regulator PrrA